MQPVFPIPVRGNVSALSNDPISSTTEKPLPATETTARSTLFAELVALYRGNELLSNELKSLKVKLIRARDYLESPTRNPPFAVANFRHIRAKHAAVLTMLRANRREAEALLRRAGPEGAAAGHPDGIPITG